jgi:hypothetical protein
MSVGMPILWSKSADGKLKEKSREFFSLCPCKDNATAQCVPQSEQPGKNSSHKPTIVNCFVRNLRLLLGNIKETDKWLRGPWGKPAFTALRSISSEGCDTSPPPPCSRPTNARCCVVSNCGRVLSLPKQTYLTKRCWVAPPQSAE